MSARRALAGFVTLAALCGGGLASAHDSDISETPIAPSPLYQGNDVKVAEHLGTIVPLDAAFETSEGKAVTLGELVTADDRPTILTFNYSDCPMLCSLQLNALVAAIPEMAVPGPVNGYTLKDAVLRVGDQFRIVTIDLEPNESIEKLAKMKARYVERLPEDQRAKARDGGWTFLHAAKRGDGSQIQRVAEAVGFSYTYIADRAEWAHPAAVMALAPTGKVTRYVYGIQFPADVMRETMFSAGISEPKSSSGFLLRCYHFDPSTKDHSRTGVLALRVGAVGFMVLLFAGLGVFHFVRRSPRRSRPEVVS